MPAMRISRGRKDTREDADRSATPESHLSTSHPVAGVGNQNRVRDGDNKVDSGSYAPRLRRVGAPHRLKHRINELEAVNAKLQVKRLIDAGQGL